MEEADVWLLLGSCASQGAANRLGEFENANELIANASKHEPQLL